MASEAKKKGKRGALLIRPRLFLTDKASTVLCSVVEHAGSGCKARMKCRGKHETQSHVFPYFLSALKLGKCFTTQSRLLSWFYDKESNNFPTHSLTKLYFPME